MFDILKTRETLAKRNKELEEQVSYLEQENDGLLDSLNNARNAATEAENKMLTMAKYRDKAAIDSIASNAARIVDNYYVWYWSSVEERTKAITNHITGIINNIHDGSAK